MSEDLHSIDDFFRKDIEGHREEPPPAVWEGVSSHLNQQQSTYYKKKYKRLKRIMLGLLGICFVAAVYVVFNKSTNNPGSKNVQRELQAAATETTDTATAKNFSNATKTINASSPGELKDSSIADNNRTKKPLETIIPATETPVGNPSEATIKTGTKQPLSVNTIVNKKPLTEIKQVTSTGENASLKQSKKPAIENALADNNSEDYAIAANTQNQPVAHQKRQQPKPQFTGPALLAAGDEKIISKKEISKQEAVTKAATVTTSLLLPTDFMPRLLSSAAYRSLVTNLPELTHGKTLLPAAAIVTGNHTRKSIHLFSLSAFGTPNFNFSRLEDDHHFSQPGRGRDDAHEEEQRNVSFSAGLLLTYQFNQRLSLQTGIGVSSFSTSINPKTIYAEHDNDGRIRYELPFSYGNAYLSPKDNPQLSVGDSAKTSVTNSRLTYINIPLALSYTIGKGRTTFHPTVGAGFNILTSSNAATNVSAVTGKESLSAAIDGLRSSYLNGQIGFGMEYSISRKFSIGLQPNISFALTPINRQTPVKSYQNFVSLQAAIRLKL